jgi:hypothetical protein
MAPSFDQGETLAERFRKHLGQEQHLYGCFMRGMADDFDAGGPVRRICEGWEDAPHGSAVQLRLLAGLFRIVLTGRAPELVPYYPCLGGTEPPGDAWPIALKVMATNEAELHESLQIAPQTNEVARSNALLVGLFAAVEATGMRRVRLLEPGASAGLNLLADRYRYEFGWRTWGPESSPVLLRGIDDEVRAVDFEIVSRRGCDHSPVDITSPEGQLRLRSFVWPFHVARHEILTAALSIATIEPPVIDRGSAADWLETQLAEPVDPEVLTVVWHSITRMYWSPDESARVDDVIRAATCRQPVARVAMEYPQVVGGEGPELTLELRDGGSPQVLADVGDHGTPVTLRK